MAITLQAAPTTHNTGGTEVSSVTFSMTTASGATCLVVNCSLENTSAGTLTVSSGTFNGDALSHFDRTSHSTWASAETWYRVDPDIVTGNCVLNFSAADKAISAAYAFAGVLDTTPLVGAKTASSASGTSVSDTVSGVVSDDYVLDVLCLDGTGHAATEGANQTERYDLETAAGQNTGCGSTQAGADGGVMSWSWTGSVPYAHIAVAVKAAGAAPTGIPHVVTAPYQPSYR